MVSEVADQPSPWRERSGRRVTLRRRAATLTMGDLHADEAAGTSAGAGCVLSRAILLVCWPLRTVLFFYSRYVTCEAEMTVETLETLANRAFPDGAHCPVN